MLRPRPEVTSQRVGKIFAHCGGFRHRKWRSRPVTIKRAPVLLSRVNSPRQKEAGGREVMDVEAALEVETLAGESEETICGLGGA